MEQKVVKIPIEEFEKDMNTESSKEKKKEIIDLLTNSNKIYSKEELNDIDYKLHDAVRRGDLELIKIYLNETISNESNSLQFKIDKTNQTASLFSINSYYDEIIIPRTVKYESTEYLITSVTGCGIYKVEAINFSEDSAVKTIYGNALFQSRINKIYFPASLKELKEGWCCEADKLTEIIISPLNGQFIYKEEKYLFGKSDENNDEFDILFFVNRKIKDVFVPSNVKKIASFAFANCSKLGKVEFPNDSNLEIIEEYAFYDSNLSEISIPPKVTKFCEFAFSRPPTYSTNKKLTKIEIPTNSNLQTIEKGAFQGTEIKEIYFPASLKELKEGWSIELNYLSKIIISPLNGQFVFKEDKYLLSKSDEKSDEFDTFLFANRSITEISIPSKVTKIAENALRYCYKLTKVEIPADSDLQIIGNSAFAETKINEIFIPSKVTKICRLAFDKCENLTKVEIPKNSNLQTIEAGAFQDTKIKEIYFPASLKELEERWSSGLNYLSKIIISPLNGQFVSKEDKYLLSKSDEKSDIFDTFQFAGRDITEISIPSEVTKICQSAFYKCKNLTKVEIPKNSNLQTIGIGAFSETKIKEIFIPPKVTKICRLAFHKCKNLAKVEIPKNSDLQIIENTAFSETKITEIFIPSKVAVINQLAFDECENLTKVEIPPDSNLQTIGNFVFSSTNIKSFCIPPKVSKILYGVFSKCKNLQIVEFSEESQLDCIPFSAFDDLNVILMIPSSLKKYYK